MDIVSKVKNVEKRVKKFITAQYIKVLTTKLSKRIQKSKKQYNSIFGVPRGGLVVAVYLSHRLNLPIVDKTGINEHTLIVDDICDSGSTLYEITKGLEIGKNLILDTACLFFREQKSKFKPTYWVAQAKKDWIVFPYELRSE